MRFGYYRSCNRYQNKGTQLVLTGFLLNIYGIMLYMLSSIFNDLEFFFFSRAFVDFAIFLHFNIGGIALIATGASVYPKEKEKRAKLVRELRNLDKAGILDHVMINRMSNTEVRAKIRRLKGHI
ncbi:MAG: hypothetical protein ACFFCS_14600 [Candidatus Hodarchaeota archaeon]